MSIRIDYMITELGVGGAQMALYRLLQGLDRDRFEPRVLTLYNGDGEIAKLIRLLNIEVIDLGMKNDKKRVDVFWRMFKLFRARRPQILHTWMFHANIPGRVIGKLAGVRKVVSAERTMGQESKKRHLLNRLTSPFADIILCVSDHVAAYAQHTIHLPRRKIRVITNGVDLERFANPPNRRKLRTRLGLRPKHIVAVAIGRLEPVKHYARLIKEWKQLLLRFPKTQLVFIGDGSEREKLQNWAEYLHIAENIRFLGYRADVNRLLVAFDIAVSSSLHEGMPNALLEAMAVGLPVVATPVGGTLDVVVDGETGILVDESHQFPISDAIAEMIEHPELREQMGQAGRRRVQTHFQLEKTISQTTALYERLVGAKNFSPLRDGGAA